MIKNKAIGSNNQSKEQRNQRIERKEREINQTSR